MWGAGRLLFPSPDIDHNPLQRGTKAPMSHWGRGGGKKKKKRQTKEQWCLWVSPSGHRAGVHGKSGAQQPWEEEGSMAGQVANGSCGI